MLTMNRRRLMTSALAAATAVAGTMFPGLPAVAQTLVSGPDRREGGKPDPTFASGTVLAATSNGLVIRSSAEQRAIRVDAATVTWNETFVPASSIVIGDVVDVSGTAQADGSLTAKQIWVNIVRFGGTLAAVGSYSFELRSPRGQAKTFQVSQHLEVLGPDGMRQKDGLLALRIGRQVGGVGVRMRQGGVRATRVWEYE